MATGALHWGNNLRSLDTPPPALSVSIFSITDEGSLLGMATQSSVPQGTTGMWPFINEAVSEPHHFCRWGGGILVRSIAARLPHPRRRSKASGNSWRSAQAPAEFGENWDMAGVVIPISPQVAKLDRLPLCGIATIFHSGSICTGKSRWEIQRRLCSLLLVKFLRPFCP